MKMFYEKDADVNLIKNKKIKSVNTNNQSNKLPS